MEFATSRYKKCRNIKKILKHLQRTGRVPHAIAQYVNL